MGNGTRAKGGEKGWGKGGGLNGGRVKGFGWGKWVGLWVGKGEEGLRVGNRGSVFGGGKGEVKGG